MDGKVQGVIMGHAVLLAKAQIIPIVTLFMNVHSETVSVERVHIISQKEKGVQA